MPEHPLSPMMVERAEHALQAVRFAVETGNRDDLREAHSAAWNLLHIVSVELAFDPAIKAWPRLSPPPAEPPGF
jgi:hypothetical protein